MHQEPIFTVPNIIQESILSLMMLTPCLNSEYSFRVLWADLRKRQPFLTESPGTHASFCFWKQCFFPIHQPKDDCCKVHIPVFLLSHTSPPYILVNQGCMLYSIISTFRCLPHWTLANNYSSVLVCTHLIYFSIAALLMRKYSAVASNTRLLIIFRL